MSADLEPVVFGTAIEALARSLKGKLTPELRAAIKSKGIDLDKLQPAYSMNTWVELVRLCGNQLLPHVPQSERYQELGRTFMLGFIETPLGLAALTIAKVIGVKRTLQRMGRNFKQATNSLEAEVTELGPKAVRIRTFTAERYLPRSADRSTLVTEYRKGLLEQTLVLIGAQGTVTIEEHHPERQDVTFRIEWK